MKTSGAYGSAVGVGVVTTTGLYWILANPHLKLFTKETINVWLGREELQDINDEPHGGIYVG